MHLSAYGLPQARNAQVYMQSELQRSFLLWIIHLPGLKVAHFLFTVIWTRFDGIRESSLFCCPLAFQQLVHNKKRLHELDPVCKLMAFIFRNIQQDAQYSYTYTSFFLLSKKKYILFKFSSFIFGSKQEHLSSRSRKCCSTSKKKF